VFSALLQATKPAIAKIANTFFILIIFLLVNLLLIQKGLRGNLKKSKKNKKKFK
jgi:hypothetical protein